MEFNSSSLGYIIDFLAGVFIVFSIIFRSRRKIKVESDTLYDGNPLVYESQLKAFWDGWIGILLLLAGTVIHIYHFDMEPSRFVSIITLILILLTIARFLISSITEREVKKRYPHYNDVKRLMKEGKYDIYP